MPNKDHNTTASAAESGLLPIGPRDHPEPRTMVWSDTELRAIRDYAARCMAAQRERWAQQLDRLGCDHCAAAIRMSQNTGNDPAA